MIINVKHIARLARLGLNREEEKKFAKELSAVLDFIAKLNEAETENIEPLTDITGAINIMRPDETNALCQDKSVKKGIMKNAPERENGYFKVKRILG